MIYLLVIAGVPRWEFTSTPPPAPPPAARAACPVSYFGADVASSKKQTVLDRTR